MKVVIVGAGPAGLFSALKFLEQGHQVVLYEKGSGAGKKLLVAGKSGLNITHSEDVNKFKNRYYENENLFDSLIKEFSNQDLINWLHSLGVDTFVGTSGRVFPRDFKAASLLNTILKKLHSFDKFSLHFNCALEKIEKNFVLINGEKVIFDKVIYCLGGASWKKLGTDGKWAALFSNHGIHINEFYPMNCGFETKWSDEMREIACNAPLKNIRLKLKSFEARGDMILTPYGIEGGPVYPLSFHLQKDGGGQVDVDLVPDLNVNQIREKLKDVRSKDSLSNILRKRFKFSKQKIKFLKELTPKHLSLDELPNALKNSSLKLSGARPLDEAISTGGGIDMKEVTEFFELKKLPRHFAIGEMLDWTAPTGGYLLQGCFSQAYRVSKAP